MITAGLKNVYDNLVRYVADKYDYKSEFDEMWIVCDREKVDDRRRDLVEVMPKCDENSYSIALTNPLFEFWLLLHVDDIEKYDNQVLFDNDYVNEAKSRRYIDKRLSEILPTGFNKKKGRFNTEIVSIENIQRALIQEKRFANDPEQILDNLGSNVGDLIRAILKLP